MLQEHGNRNGVLMPRTHGLPRARNREFARTVVLKLKNQRIQDPHSQPHRSVLHSFLRGADEYRPITATTCRPPTAPAVSPGWRRPEQLLRTLRMGPLSRLFYLNHTALSVRSLLSSPKKTDWLLHGSSGLRRSLSSARPRREHLQQRTCRQPLYQACPPHLSRKRSGTRRPDAVHRPERFCALSCAKDGGGHAWYSGCRQVRCCKCSRRA